MSAFLPLSVAVITFALCMNKVHWWRLKRLDVKKVLVYLSEMENMKGLVWASENSLWYKLLFWKTLAVFWRKWEMNLVQGINLESFLCWICSLVSKRYTNAPVFISPLTAWRQKVGQYSAWLKKCNKIISRKDLFSESEGWEVTS